MAQFPLGLLLIPLGLQAVAMAFDEFYFHQRRGLRVWERIGHPIDTITVLLCFGFLALNDVSDRNLYIYLGLSFFSCVFVTKDEFVHTESCEARENWLHAFLFVLHPIVFFSAGVIWYYNLLPGFMKLQAAVLVAFLIYQIIYWSSHGERQQRDL